ncbi:MAG: cytochrome c-type biogenesis protein CcmH [Rhodanobacteraceae bacterium]|nr:cytochrome c-type biogenesis protein CcmH [Xanthomonadales bacterium]MCP5478904.1 cytochrome c-type biogenesis protein CcmH [Rhodanobacteraceae bacterium]HPF73544.1 cytochrome c-type biogenesis protein CcmH [Xanthomonadaceae bacterium]HRY00011.1 cytochrome c-type biogenesis protein CcmH [Xanthomonadaceae bacterium]
MTRALACLLLLALLPLRAFAVEPLPFRDHAEELRFQQLTAELRCVKCQNQSLADSNAPIAHDLRREVFALMREGHSNDEIKTFLRQRYGDFVLYSPPMNGDTLLIWAAPPLVLLAGTITLWLVVRGRRKSSGSNPSLQPEDDA